MADPIQIRMGGYGPPTTTFSRGLKMIGDRLTARFGDRVDIKYAWNIMDLGYRGEEIWWLVESGLLTLGYQSSSALTNRVPELGIADLPFLFATNEEARAAVDGPLGQMMTSRIEDRVNYRILGYFENGFRHISNRLRPLRSPDDIRGMRIRTLNSTVHARTFERLGAIPNSMGLKEAIAAMKAGEVDAQENPMANTVSYGAHTLHHFHTLTSHFYISRPIFINRTAFELWPADIQEGMRDAVNDAVAAQRDLAVEEEEVSKRAILAQGCDLEVMGEDERRAFAKAVRPVYENVRKEVDPAAFRAIERAGAAALA